MGKRRREYGKATKAGSPKRPVNSTMRVVKELERMKTEGLLELDGPLGPETLIEAA